jgi:hypothetical protein
MAQVNYAGTTGNYQDMAKKKAVQDAINSEAKNDSYAAEMRQQAERERTALADSQMAAEDRLPAAEGADPDQIGSALTGIGQGMQDIQTPVQATSERGISQVEMANQKYQNSLEELIEFRKRLMGR